MKENNKKIIDIINEMLTIGSFFKNPNLYIEYGSLMRAKYDFSDEVSKFLYNSFELCYTTFSTDIEESKFNIFMYQDEERKKKYINIGGWKTIQKQIDLSDPDDFKNYFNKLKKFSLLREFENKGFPIEKIVNYKNFDKMTADDVIMTFRRNLDNINTIIGGSSDSILLGKDMTKVLESWREVPDIGELFPFDRWSSLFRGWRKKKLIALGMLSNSGKSRLIAMFAAYFGILKRKPVLILENEMSKSDFDAAVLTAVCNNKHFGFCLNIPENRIVTGEYESEEEYEKVKEVARYIEQNTRIRFLEMSDYSDAKITTEVKKHCLGYGIEYLFYDTMKDYGMSSWEKLKATSVLLKDLCNELNVAGLATIQLTDDTVNFDIFDLTSMNVASSKQVKHVLDHLVFGKLISRSEYDKYLILNDGWGDYPLDTKKKYMGMIVDKNRAGPKGSVMAYEINLDTNEWVEVGLLKRNYVEKEKKKSHK